MHICCYNIKNYCMKHSKEWGVHSFQIDGQAFTSSYANSGHWGRLSKPQVTIRPLEQTRAPMV